MATSSEIKISREEKTPSLLKYTSLLFAFPAAALVNYAGIALDSTDHAGAKWLFLLFVFLILEVSTSRFWVQLEYLISRNLPKPRTRHPERSVSDSRAFWIAVTDVVRAFLLMGFYISILKSIGRNDISLEFLRMTFLFFASFLFANFVWNRLVSPEHKIAIAEYKARFNHEGRADKIYRGLIYILHTVQIVLFDVIFPIFSGAALLLAIGGWAAPIIENQTFDTIQSKFSSICWFLVSSDRNLTLALIGWTLVVQTIAKALQEWLLSDVVRAAEPKPLD